MSEMMKTEKLNELLGEVIHIACAAELASDEQIKVQAIGDIYDALASVMPVDHGTKAKARGEGEVLYKTPKHILDFIAEIANVPFADMTHPAFLKRVAENFHLEPNKTEDEQTGFSKFLAASNDVRFVRFSGNGETRLVATCRGKFGSPNSIFEIHVDHIDDVATIFRDGKMMFYIQGETIGHSFVEKLAISCMHRYLKENKMTNEKKKRRRARKAAEKLAADGVATPGREGAARTGEEA